MSLKKKIPFDLYNNEILMLYYIFFSKTKFSENKIITPSPTRINKPHKMMNRDKYRLVSYTFDV